jgi:hypothetical protein
MTCSRQEWPATDRTHHLPYRVVEKLGGGGMAGRTLSDLYLVEGLK